MIPQTLLGSLSAHLHIPRSSPSSAFPIAPTDWHAGCPSDGEVYEEGPWRGVLLNEWYLLGRICDWEQSGVAERDAPSDIEWAPSPAVEPLLRTRSAASTKAEDARELEIWWGSPRSPGGKEVCDREPQWIAIHARSVLPLPYLIKHWGTPPEPVQEDWKRQCGILGLQTQSIWILASLEGILYRIDETRTSPSLTAVHRTTPVANPLQKNSKRAGDRAVHRGLQAAGLLVLVVVIGWMLQRGVPATGTKMHSIPTISEKKEGVSKESTLLPQPLPSLESREIPQELGEVPELVTDPDLALLDSDPYEDWTMANTMGGSGMGVEPEPILPGIDLALFSKPSHVSDEVTDAQPPLAAKQVLGFHGEAKPDEVSDSELQEIESVAEGIRTFFPVSGGLARHRIGTGSSIAAARATCLATLSMIDNSDQGLSITPSDACMLLGESTQQWVVALEEEAPELVVELESRPARRWELRIKTGVREHRHAPIYWLHAGQASRVLDQMDLGRRSAEAELGRMQSMLDGGQSMGPFSPRQRRRQLQQLDKELERCIEIWKVVERLSLIVLDHAQIAVELQTPTQFPSQAVSPPEKVSNR